MPGTLVLLRHGQSTWNLENLFTGWRDVPLTAQGEAGWINGQPQVQLDAKLQRLRASIRTDRQMTVSGDIKASLQGRQAELTGQLVVDQARILLPDEGTPQLGSDVIVRNAGSAATGRC